MVIAVVKMLSQCPDCLDILLDVGKRMPVSQKSVVHFEKLPQTQCYRCGISKEEDDIEKTKADTREWLEEQREERGEY